MQWSSLCSQGLKSLLETCSRGSGRQQPDSDDDYQSDHRLGDGVVEVTKEDSSCTGELVPPLGTCDNSDEQLRNGPDNVDDLVRQRNLFKSTPSTHTSEQSEDLFLAAEIEGGSSTTSGYTTLTSTADISNSPEIPVESLDKGGGEGELENAGWECRFCRKMFKDSRALGGHMNSHRKERFEERSRASPKLNRCRTRAHSTASRVLGREAIHTASRHRAAAAAAKRRMTTRLWDVASSSMSAMPTPDWVHSQYTEPGQLLSMLYTTAGKYWDPGQLIFMQNEHRLNVCSLGCISSGETLVADVASCPFRVAQEGGEGMCEASGEAFVGEIDYCAFGSAKDGALYEATQQSMMRSAGARAVRTEAAFQVTYGYEQRQRQRLSLVDLVADSGQPTGGGGWHDVETEAFRVANDGCEQRQRQRWSPVHLVAHSGEPTCRGGWHDHDGETEAFQVAYGCEHRPRVVDSGELTGDCGRWWGQSTSRTDERSLLSQVAGQADWSLEGSASLAVCIADVAAISEWVALQQQPAACTSSVHWQADMFRGAEEYGMLSLGCNSAEIVVTYPPVWEPQGLQQMLLRASSSMTGFDTLCGRRLTQALPVRVVEHGARQRTGCVPPSRETPKLKHLKGIVWPAATPMPPSTPTFATRLAVPSAVATHCPNWMYLCDMEASGLLGRDTSNIVSPVGDDNASDFSLDALLLPVGQRRSLSLRDVPPRAEAACGAANLLSQTTSFDDNGYFVPSMRTEQCHADLSGGPLSFLTETAGAGCAAGAASMSVGGSRSGQQQQQLPSSVPIMAFTNLPQQDQVLQCLCQQSPSCESPPQRVGLMTDNNTVTVERALSSDCLSWSGMLSPGPTMTLAISRSSMLHDHMGLAAESPSWTALELENLGFGPDLPVVGAVQYGWISGTIQHFRSL